MRWRGRCRRAFHRSFTPPREGAGRFTRSASARRRRRLRRLLRHARAARQRGQVLRARGSFAAKWRSRHWKGQAAVSTAERQVALVLAPIDARVYRDGTDLGAMPVTLSARGRRGRVDRSQTTGLLYAQGEDRRAKVAVIVRLTPIPGIKPAVPVPETTEAAPAGADVEAAEATDEGESAAGPWCGAGRCELRRAEGQDRAGSRKGRSQPQIPTKRGRAGSNTRNDSPDTSARQRCARAASIEPQRGANLRCRDYWPGASLAASQVPPPVPLSVVPPSRGGQRGHW